MAPWPVYAVLGNPPFSGPLPQIPQDGMYASLNHPSSRNKTAYLPLILKRLSKYREMWEYSDYSNLQLLKRWGEYNRECCPILKDTG